MYILVYTYMLYISPRGVTPPGEGGFLGSIYRVKIFLLDLCANEFALHLCIWSRSIYCVRMHLHLYCADAFPPVLCNYILTTSISCANEFWLDLYVFSHVVWFISCATAVFISVAQLHFHIYCANAFSSLLCTRISSCILKMFFHWIYLLCALFRISDSWTLVCFIVL